VVTGKAGTVMRTRNAIKRAIKWFFLAATLPLYGLFLAICIVSRSDNCFASFSQFLSLIPGKIGVYFRAAFYHMACPDTSDEISIGFLTLLSHRDTSIASGVYIGPQCNIGMCAISKNTLIGSGVHVLSGSKQHNFDDPNRPIQDQNGKFEKIYIGTDCWLGNGSIIMASVSDRSIIGAGSVIVTQTKMNSINGGNPAKIIRYRS